MLVPSAAAAMLLFAPQLSSHRRHSSTLLCVDRYLTEAVRECNVEAFNALLADDGRASPHDLQDQGFTLLHVAAWSNCVAVLELLLAKGLDVNVRALGGATPLQVATAAANAEAEAVLLAAGAVHMPNLDPKTVLHDVTLVGRGGACVQLSTAGNEPDVHGFTPLRWAALCGHASVVRELLLKDTGAHEADLATPIQGMTPLMLASAAGHVEVVKALLEGGARVGQRVGTSGLNALSVARGMCRHDVVDVLLEWSATGSGPNDWRTSQLRGPIGWLKQAISLDRKAPPSSASAKAECRSCTVEDLFADPMLFASSLSEGVPLLVHGFGREWSAQVRRWDVAELRRRWGEQTVLVSFCPDSKYQRCTPPLGVAPDAAQLSESILLEPPYFEMRFAEFTDLLPMHGEHEFFAVQQSRCDSLAKFEGLPSVPPFLEDYLAGAGPLAQARLRLSRLRANLWVCQPPKLSALHYDSDDSLLIQLAGTKRFTLIDPRPLHGISVYPSVQPVAELRRHARGWYEQLQPDPTEYPIGNFPLVNATSPDLRRHPLFKYARLVTIDVPEGSALVLPAHWYHQVESGTARPGQLNVAINYWFSTGTAHQSLHKRLRDHLRIDCVP